MITGAIFDADGTLLDSMPIWDTIGEDYLHAIGCEPRENLAQTFKTFSLEQAAAYYQREYAVALSTEDIIHGINDMIGRFYKEQVQLKPGAADFLKELGRRGVAMCIATATDRYLVEAALKRCGVLPYFSEIFTCSAVGFSKNEPFIFRAAREHLKTEKERTVVFEDALHAAQTAKKDGFPVVGVYDASEHEQGAIRACTDCFLPDFVDLETFWKFALEVG